MKTRELLKVCVAAVLAVAVLGSAAEAGLTATGDVSPADPATWTSSTDAYVGQTGVGSVTVDVGSDLLSHTSYLGYDAAATGAVTVDGPGSTWSNSEHLYVGYYGSGTLNITNGGSVSVDVFSSIGTVAGATGAVTVDGAGSTWTNAHGVTVGHFGDGTLDITSGGAVTTNSTSYIGMGSFSTGVATVDGAGSTWIQSGWSHCIVGYQGDGTLNITDGGLVDVPYSTYVGWYAWVDGAIDFDNGTLTTGGFLTSPTDLSGTGTVNAHGLVSDVDLVFDATHSLTQALAFTGPGRNITVNLDVDGSAPIGAAYRGAGSMHVADGVTVQSTKGLLGYQLGSAGVATVTGTGSTWANSDDLYVGYYGDGTLDITAGGAVYSDLGCIGHLADSSSVVTVTGPGSTWTSSGELHVGNVGDGTLNITDGGAVNSDSGYIGNESGSTGAVTVAGAGSTWTNTGGLLVGSLGDGTLDITNGGAVSNTAGYIGALADSTGAVTVAGPGSIWTNADGLSVGFLGPGTLHITDGGAVSNTVGYIGAFSSDAPGTVTVDGTDSTWTNFGNLYVGNPGSGTLRLHDGGMVGAGGNATFGSTAAFEIGLSGAAMESRLDVGGLASLAGALDVGLLDGYAPSVGNWFLIIDAGSLSGTFDTFTFPNAQQWAVDYDTVAADVSVGLIGWSPGNFDGDTDIDADDIDILCDNIGGDPGTYDLDGDGDVDEDDLIYMVESLVEWSRPGGFSGVGTERGDANLDGLVNATDLAIMKANFAQTGIGWSGANLNVDDVVNATDLAIMKATFGSVAPTATVPEPVSLLVMAAAGLPLLLKRKRKSRA